MTEISSPACRTPASARDLRRQDKVRQIIEAATEVFLEDGYSAASMDKIVERAGVSKRTIYNYYESKEEVFVDVMQTQLVDMYENFEPGWRDSEDLASQLRLVGAELLQITNAPKTIALFRITAAEAQRFPELARKFLEQSFERIIDGLASLLEASNKNPIIFIDDPRMASEYFIDLLLGTAYDRVIFGTMPPMDDATIGARIQRALDYFFRTYQSSRPVGRSAP